MASSAALWSVLPQVELNCVCYFVFSGSFRGQLGRHWCFDLLVIVLCESNPFRSWSKNCISDAEMLHTAGDKKEINSKKTQVLNQDLHAVLSERFACQRACTLPFRELQYIACAGTKLRQHWPALFTRREPFMTGEHVCGNQTSIRLSSLVAAGCAVSVLPHRLFDQTA